MRPSKRKWKPSGVRTHKREDEKKHRAKYFDIPDAQVPDAAPIIINAVVRERLNAGKWVGLWNFTNQGLDDVTRDPAAPDYDALHVVLEGDSLALTSAHNQKRAAASVDDRNLSWPDFTKAAARLLSAMEETKWPKKTVDMFDAFFMALQVMELRSTDMTTTTTRAILLYQAEVRKQWHNTIGTTGQYSIAVINKTLYADCVSRITLANALASEKDRNIRYVSILSEWVQAFC